MFKHMPKNHHLWVGRHAIGWVPQATSQTVGVGWVPQATSQTFGKTFVATGKIAQQMPQLVVVITRLPHLFLSKSPQMPQIS